MQVNSAFFTGIYGMWNLYVFALMFLYAPSHKNCGDDQSNGDLRVHSREEPQLTPTTTYVDGPTEIYTWSRNEAQESMAAAPGCSCPHIPAFLTTERSSLCKQMLDCSGSLAVVSGTSGVGVVTLPSDHSSWRKDSCSH